MTMNKLISRLSRNSIDFLLAGELEKSNACMTLLEFIKENDLKTVKGKLSVDNL